MVEDVVEEVVGDEPPPEQEEQEPEQIKILNLKVLAVIREAQQKHGLRHADYQRYRAYCSRRVRRLRKALGLVQGVKKKFQKKDVTGDILKDEKHLTWVAFLFLLPNLYSLPTLSVFLWSGDVLVLLPMNRLQLRPVHHRWLLSFFFLDHSNH